MRGDRFRFNIASFMVIIDAMDIRKVDLNLLAALRVLLNERHVTHAAEKLGITQPAMSASLARARLLFGDQLLVRGPKGLTPTDRGLRLIEQLDQVFEVIEDMIVLAPGFAPETTQRTFTLIGSDMIEGVLLPPLMADLAKSAPLVQIVFRPPNPKNLEMLLSEGEVDLAIGYLPDAPLRLMRSIVFHDPFACIARQGHPQLPADHFPLDRFVELQHVQVLPRDATMYAAPIDAALGAQGLVRSIALWHPSFQVVAAIVATTDLIATLPRRLALRAAEQYPIAVYDPPIQLPAADFALFWHARSQEDSGHKWLRAKVAVLLRN